MKIMELKNYNPKTSEDWQIAAKYDSVEFNDVEEYIPSIVEIDDQEDINELD